MNPSFASRYIIGKRNRQHLKQPLGHGKHRDRCLALCILGMPTARLTSRCGFPMRDGQGAGARPR